MLPSQSSAFTVSIVKLPQAHGPRVRAEEIEECHGNVYTKNSRAIIGKDPQKITHMCRFGWRLDVLPQAI